MTEETYSFEQAFQRLEHILDQMNTPERTLEESLVLYEEASKLVTLCQERLQDADRRIEVLVKNRQGDIVMNNGKAETQAFV